MKIAHASIPADNPEQAAKVLASIMQGEALRFPPGGPDAWMAWSGDGAIDFEIVPRGHLIHRGEVEAEWRPSADGGRLSEVHLAVCVDRPADEIVAIASEAGWPARHCDRGEGVFQLVEVWVEGAFMIEFLDPQQTEHYHRVVTLETWKGFIAAMEGGEAAPA